MTAACTHSFPDPFPQPMTQLGDCRGCGISYQEAKAAMTTPADELRAASARLRDLTTALGDCRGPWYVVNREQHPYPQRIDNIGVPYIVASTTTDPSHSPTIADYICTMHPGVGKALAIWLDSAAEDAEQIGVDFRALDLARQINTGSQP